MYWLPAGKPCRDLAVVLQEEVQDTRKTLGDCEIGPNAVVDLVLPKDPQDQAQLKTPLERSQTMVRRGRLPEPGSRP